MAKAKPKNKEASSVQKLNDILAIASRRGFFFQTAEIYGGRAGFYTYGHIGTLMKRKFENLWRSYFLSLHDNFWEIESNCILPEPVFRASGHIENFNDPLVECKKCHFRFRADQLIEDSGFNMESFELDEINKIIKEQELKCPKCGGELSEAKWFNMMFCTQLGFNGEIAYLSPETAQQAYLAFKQEFEATRKKLPLGLAIIGKAFRNEISPRQLFFRLREFTQAELQIFFDPSKLDSISEEAWREIKGYKLRVKFAGSNDVTELSCEDLNKKGLPRLYLYYLVAVQRFYLDLVAIPRDRFRLRELGEAERAFYNKIHFDVELLLDTLGGFKEVAGVHYRTDHDLKGHAKVSGKNLEIFHEGKRFIPHVIELSFGIDRNIWALLDIFYDKSKEQSDTAVFRFPPRVAPLDLAVLPLVNKEGIPELAREVYMQLKERFTCVYDDAGSIGRRYARNDEIGTPYCITIDGESLD